MRRILLGFFLLNLFIMPVMSQQGNVNTIPIWYSPSLGLKSLAPVDIQAALRQDFWQIPEDVKLKQDILQKVPSNSNIASYIPNNCNELEQLLTKYHIENIEDVLGEIHGSQEEMEDGMDLYFKKMLPRLGEYQNICQSIKLLKTAKQSKMSFVRDLLSNKNVLKYLPAMMNSNKYFCLDGTDTKWENNPQASWYLQDKEDSSIRQVPAMVIGETGDKDDYPLLNFQYKFINQTANHLSFKVFDQYGDEYKVVITVLAYGDFLNTGFEQALLQESVSGDSLGTRVALYLISRSVPSKIVTVYQRENYYENYKKYPYAMCNLHLYDLNKSLSKNQM